MKSNQISETNQINENNQISETNQINENNQISENNQNKLIGPLIYVLPVQPKGLSWISPTLTWSYSIILKHTPDQYV